MYLPAGIGPTLPYFLKKPLLTALAECFLKDDR